MDNEEFINERAVTLPPTDSVLFLFNIASDNNFNRPDIEVGPVVKIDDTGRTRVNMKGLEYRGLSGNPSAKGTARFVYNRTALTNLNFPDDGSFFDLMGEPNFIAAVEEFRRRTQFNCTVDDFDESAFYPDADGNRWLKAKETSHRFVGQVKLGRPRRDKIDVVAHQNISANLSSYNGIFFRNADRLGINLDIGHRYDVYSVITVGQLFTNINDPCVQFVLQHLERKNIEAGFSDSPINGVNIHGARITYKGALRPQDYPAPNDRDRVIAAQLKPIPGTWVGGELKFYYSSERSTSLSFVPSNVQPFNMTKPHVWTGEVAEALEALTVGKHFSDIQPIRLANDIFQLLMGIPYDPSLHSGFRVIYNGPNRPFDQLPTDVLTAQVVVFEPNGSRAGAVSGPFKILYKVN